METWISAGIAGVLSLAGYVRYRRRGIPLWFMGTALLATVVMIVFMLRTAHLGGHIRHPEARFELKKEAGRVSAVR